MNTNAAVKKIMLISNRKIVPNFVTSKDLVNSLPLDSTYTVCRTTKKLRIVDYGNHLNRLSALPEVSNVVNFESHLDRYASKILYHFNDHYLSIGDEAAETRLTICVSKKSNEEYIDDFGIDLLLFGEKLPPIPQPPIIAVSVLGHRDSPELKSSNWVQERKKYELKLENDEKAEDYVLVNEKGYFSEGLSSNFAILDQEGTIITAPKGTVLEGTTLHIILAACEAQGIKVDRRLIHTSEIPNCTAAFISSTSRGLLEIQKLYLFGQQFKFDSRNPTLVRVQERIKTAEIENSKLIPYLE